MKNTDQISLDEELKRAEIGKILYEIKSSSYLFWVELLKLFGGFILSALSVFIAYTQFQEARVAKLEAKDAKKSEQVAVNQLQESKTEKAEFKESLELQASEPKPTESKLIYIQFQGDTTRAFINELRAELQTESFNAPGAERIAKTYKSSIKYFSTASEDNDKFDAERLAKVISDFYKSKGCNLNIPVVSVQSNKKSPIEVWLSANDSCKN